MDTETHVRRRWTPPVETRVADIHGWLQDIQTTLEFVTRLSDELDAESHDLVLLDALCTAALIRYSRCFTTGIRRYMSIDELPTASSADKELHVRLRGIRDWHIAHPINKQEAHALYVILDGSEGATTGAIGFSSLSSTHSPLEVYELTPIQNLCEKWIEWLKDQLIEEETKLIRYANRLSRAELLSLPQDEPEPSSNIRARRRQVQS